MIEKLIRRLTILIILVPTFSIRCAINRPLTINTASQPSPYPPSQLINGIKIDWTTHRKLAAGSDNWPVTWADDNHIYTSWGDGGGFGGSNTVGRVSLGIARIEGLAGNFTGYNVWGGRNPENPAQFEGKSYGIVSLNGTLYMWVSPGSNEQNYDEARLAYSTNHGATWIKINWAFTKSDHLVLPTVLQFGKDYSGARDNYVYMYSIRLKNGTKLAIQKPGQIDMFRVEHQKILDRDSYQFYTGLDSNGNPIWSYDISARVPVFEDANGVGWNVSVTYNAGLKRYILATEHEISAVGNLGLFDAPEPWGPWTTTGYYNNWESRGTNFYWNFSNKWTSMDGRDITVLFTGIDENDSWNSVQGRVEIVDDSNQYFYLYFPMVLIID